MGNGKQGARAPRNDGRIEGTIVRLVKDKGFGFVSANNIDHFFHRSAFDGVFNDLRDGTRVSFTPGEGTKGPRAEAVRLAD